MNKEELKLQKWYKVLDENGKSYNGGNMQYSLPTDKEGEWHEETNISMCSSGLHLTNKPIEWLCENFRIFEVEIDWEKDVVFNDEDKATNYAEAANYRLSISELISEDANKNEL